MICLRLHFNEKGNITTTAFPESSQVYLSKNLVYMTNMGHKKSL